MLPRCSSMWPDRTPPRSAALIGGTPARTGPRWSSAASPRPRSIAAAAAAFFLCSAIVSAFVQLACSRAWVAFIASSASLGMLGPGLPSASVLRIPPMPSWLVAMWWATTPTGQFSAAVSFFQSASLSRSNTDVASCTLVSNCLASVSPRAVIMASSTGGRGGRDRRHLHAVVVKHGAPTHVGVALGDGDVDVGGAGHALGPEALAGRRHAGPDAVADPHARPE